MDYLIVPPPSGIEYREGYLKIGLKVLSDDVEKFLSGGKPPSGVQFRINDGIKMEGYRLEIDPSGITVTASGDSGVYYGIQTLKQIIRQSRDGALRCLEITDEPVFETRSVMLDISRNKVPSMETIFNLVDIWSELKLNQLQLYTEHTFAYKTHPDVWKDASPFTPEEIRELDSYCRDRGMELVPNQNSFGHMERWLKYDKYRSLAESPEGYTDPSGIFFSTPSTLDPDSKEVMDFLKGLYDELLPNFSSRILNVGGDETYDLCQGKSGKKCREKGSGRVYLDYIKKLYKEVSGRGYRMQLYGDIIVKYPHLIEELPEDVIVLDWGYEGSHPFEKETAAFHKTGLDYYVCTGTSAWNSIAGRWSNALENIRSGAYYGRVNRAAGFMITEWGDNGHMQQFPVPVPGYYAGAAAAWRGEEGLNLDFQKALSIHFFNDSTGKAAEALLKMADIYKDYSNNMHNSSIFAISMLEVAYPGYREFYPSLKGIDFSRAKEIIPTVHELIRDSRLSGTEGRLIKDELVFTAEMLKHGMVLTENLFRTPGLEIQQIPYQKRKELSVSLRELIPLFEELWILRNRKGGLSDTLSLLQKLDSLYMA